MEELILKKKYNYTKKTGRPEKTVNDLPSNWKEIVFFMASKGASEVEIRGQLVLSGGMKVHCIEVLWQKLQERNEEFLRTIKISRVLCEKWWVEKARTKLSSPYFQSFVWFCNMKNRFGWKDKQELELDASDNLIEKFSQLHNKKLLERADELLSKNRAITRVTIN